MYAICLIKMFKWQIWIHIIINSELLTAFKSIYQNINYSQLHINVHYPNTIDLSSRFVRVDTLNLCSSIIMEFMDISRIGWFYQWASIFCILYIFDIWYDKILYNKDLGFTKTCQCDISKNKGTRQNCLVSIIVDWILSLPDKGIQYQANCYIIKLFQCY